MIFKRLFNWNKLFKHLIRYKIYVDRARWYLAFAQTVLMIAIFFQTADTKLSLMDYLTITASTVIGFVVIGWIDVKIFNAMKEEQRQYSEQNPVIMDIYKMVKEIGEREN